MSSQPNNELADSVDHKVAIDERKAWSVDGFLAAVLLLALTAVAVWQLVIAAQGLEAGEQELPRLVVAVLILILVSLGSTSFTVVAPGQTKVVQFFGRYVGTIRKTGFQLAVPLSNRTDVSVRVHNFETNELKVNDADGNPINIASIVVWQVQDTAKAQFAVEDYGNFVAVQAESALRHVAMSHPYDSKDDQTSLRGDTELIAGQLAEEVSKRVTLAGVKVIEVRISSLAYAPEIAQAMLQRQQAAAVIAAREKIVDGAVGMVQKALEQLENDEIVELDDERKAAMVSNLLVVLCSERDTTPVVNASSLYS